MWCLKSSSSLLRCAILLAITADVTHSKYVYHRKSHRKIAQHKEVATWDEAKHRCESEGATLASPISEGLLQDMMSIITVNNHSTPYFIGFRAWNNAEFSSEEGFLLADVPGAYEMVEHIDPELGDCLCMDEHNIRVEPCWSRLPFICYTNKTSPETALADIPVIRLKHKHKNTDFCADYKQYPTGSYKLHKVSANWTSAYWTCVAEDAYLVVINDSEEAEVVSGILKGIEAFTWVGLRAVNGNNNWVAITGEPVDELHNVWHDAHDKYPCAYMRYRNWGLEAGDCTIDWFHFVCEK